MVLREGGDYQKMIGGFDTPSEPEPRTTETIPTPAPTTQAKPGWVHAHPYLAASIAVLALLVLGTTLFLQRTDVNPANESGAWGGAGGLFFGALRATLPSRPSFDDVAKLQSPQGSYAPIPIYTPPPEYSQEDTPFNEDITTLLAQLVQPVAGPSDLSSTDTPDSYSFIPQGLISTEPTTEKRSKLQESLHAYGNLVGTFVKAFEDTHYGTAQILKDHIEDRANPDKQALIRYLGLDFAQLGADLENLQNVPEGATSMHKAYATTYRIVGTNLVKVSETTTDEEFLDAISTYNTSVESLTKRFLLLVALFNANNVTFSSSDPGNIFMFNPNLSSLQ